MAPSRQPAKTNLHPVQVVDIAEGISLECRRSDGSLDVNCLVESLGGIIRFKDIWAGGSEKSESIIIQKEGLFEINVSKSSTSYYRNFVLAHEIGHYVLHYLWNNSTGAKIQRLAAYMSRENSPEELEANLFACAATMPRKIIKAIAREDGADSIEMRVSNRMRVPVKNAKIWTEAVLSKKY